MSTRQKSFFDQDSKPTYLKGQWTRPRNNQPPHHNTHQVPAPRQVITGPPIMPSTQSRTKLKAYQFIEGAPTEENMKRGEAEKENQPVAFQPKETPKSSKIIEMDSNTSKTPKIFHSKTCPPPSTPATRLPLADLVGNADDSRRNLPQPEISPEEQLGWRGSQPVNTPIPRKRKRARSSSPVGASQEEMKMVDIQKNEHTPVADPATELWNKYTSNNGAPSANKTVTFAHLINESSPRSSAQAGSVSGLRRWASCGVEFPTSATKKRRTKGMFKSAQDVNGDVFSSSDGVVEGQTEKPKLADMLQRMRDALPQTRSKMSSQQLPSSSSPLPEAGACLEAPLEPSESPIRQRQNREQNANVSQLVNDDPDVIDQETTILNDAHQRSFASSDDFGDIDMEMVDALEISQRGPEHSKNQATTPSEPVKPVSEAPRQTTKTSDTPVVSTGSDDEFDIDEDVFAADLEQVASLYDNRPEVTPPCNEAQPSGLQNDVANEVVSPVVHVIEDDSDDDFGGDIDADEFAAAEVAATQGGGTSQQDTRAIQRYLIKRVDEGSYTTDRGYRMPEKVLLVEDEKTKLFKAITLRQSWYDTPCTTESFVHVIGEFSKTGQCIIDDHQNMLILHPDHLISATVVADSFGCLRRAVLQDRIKATSKTNAPMLYGTLLHELFQEAIKVNRWDSEFLMKTIDTLLPGKFESILEINSTCEQVKEHLSSKLPELQTWSEIFVRAEPRADAVVHERNGRQSIMSINKLLDVEEHVWSPMYGLKGNIDATVQVTMQDDKGERTLTVPFEVKTGKNSSNASHFAQTALYNLLLSNRYDVDVSYGILYYLEVSQISRIPNIRNDIIHMIIKRNELACYVRDRIELPLMLKEDFKCQKCYAQESCFLYNKLVEDGEGELLNKKAKERYDELVRSLKPSDATFMKKWDTLLTKEESDMMKFRRELWTMLSTEREKLGRCFSNVILEPGSSYEEKNDQKINRYRYTFIKQKPKPGFSFTESQLIIGEPVVVSDEKGHFALANGYVTNVRKHRISVAVDRRLHNARTRLPGFNSQNNQTFAGIMEVTKEGQPIFPSQEDDEPVLYRLDKDEFSNGMAAARNNLVQIMDDSVYKGRELRSLIVDLRPPTFKAGQTYIPPGQSKEMAINADQKAAIAKVLSAKDYALVLGMPGTGKTTTIAHIIRALVARGKSVLLTSYTHTAVDNILLKIREDDIGILRLGAAAKVHPDVREFATLATTPTNSLEELEKQWMDPPVVATTCLTINHPLFNRRIFDYCIVDEASQITLPVCLGPIRMAKTFILVGDHHQLPPLVQNKEALEGGLDVSLFKLLCETHPQAVTYLEHQYRMNAEVMLLSNEFIYSGRLKCGNKAVANRRLIVPTPNGLHAHHYQTRSARAHTDSMCPGPKSPTCWLANALSPSNSVVFINTDNISAKLETQFGSRITNTTEARLITHLTISLLSMGISVNEIGVIAFYRSQLALLRQSLSNARTQTQSSELAGPAMGGGAGAAGVELHTADKFQGRDKEIVLVSCVRSNTNQAVGDLLKDRRRVNVALTRARSKLIIVGSESTLSSNDLLKDIVALCREKGWVFDLAPDMLDSHTFPETFTQTGNFASIKSSYQQAQTQSPTPSPTPKRKALGDVTSSGAANKSPVKRGGLKKPGKVITAGKKGVLNGRPLLKDIFYGAM